MPDQPNNAEAPSVEQSIIDEIKSMPEYVASDDEEKIKVPKPAEEPKAPENPEEIDAGEEVEEPAEDPEEIAAGEDDLDKKLVKVKVGDEEKELPISELKKGYMLQADYTRKTQEAADIKKAHIQGAEQLNKLVNYISENFDASILVSEEKDLEDTLKSIDVRNLSSDQLLDYQKLKARYEQVKQGNDERRAELQQLKEIQAAKRQEYISTLKKEADRRLVQAIPEYSNPQNKKADEEKISQFLTNLYGDDAQRIAKGIIDHRDYMAMRYAAIGYEYLNAKKPNKAIKPIKTLRNAGVRNDLPEPGQNNTATNVLRKVRSRGDRAEASQEEIMEFIKNSM